MDNVPLVHPEHFPSLFDQPLVPYEIVRSTFGSLMGLSIELQADARAHEGKVGDVAISDDKLECEITVAQDFEHGQLVARCSIAERTGLAADGRGAVRVPRIGTEHSQTGIRALPTEAPVALAGSFGDDFSGTVGDAALGFLGTHSNPVALAPCRQRALAGADIALDGAQRFAGAQVTTFDEIENGCAVGQWKHATIVSIADVDATPSVWNLAVLDDESYVADGLIVHNCRSVLVPITQIDGWDGVESDEPTVQPQDGFGAGEK